MRLKPVIAAASTAFLLACQQANNGGDGPGVIAEEQANGMAKPDVQLPDLGGKAETTEKTPARQGVKKLLHIKNAADDEAENLSVSAALPDFSSIQDTAEKKRRFIAFIKPLVEAENARIEKKRHLIVNLYKGVQKGRPLTRTDEQWLSQVAEEYRVQNRDFPSDEAFRNLLLHVDVIPVDLAVMQAANESAWGTSRFARLANNMFGQWCFEPGCGVVPAQRGKGAKHEVASFLTVAHSVESYMRNLNSHPAYRQLRVLRYQRRLEGEAPSGYIIAVGLQKYAGIGMEYVDTLRSMMKSNQSLL